MNNKRSFEVFSYHSSHVEWSVFMILVPFSCHIAVMKKELPHVLVIQCTSACAPNCGPTPPYVA